MENRIEQAFYEQAALFTRAAKPMAAQLKAAAELFVRTFRKGGKILFCGNGGSAADAQHLAAELVVRLTSRGSRSALPAIALTVDSSILTACGNDFGFEKIFSRQVEALGKKDDLLVGISTSGNSENVIEALKTAKKMRMRTLLLCGNFNESCPADLVISVPADEVTRIQEVHIFTGHLLIEMTEELLFKG